MTANLFNTHATFQVEWGYEDARDVFRSANDAENATKESRREAFDMICENFSPGIISDIC